MIIVLAGAMGSGKDTIGDLLVKHYGFKKHSFADPLKKMAKMAFPAFTDEDLYGSSSNRENQYKQYPFSGICLNCGLHCKKILEDAHGDFLWSCLHCQRGYTQYVSPRMALQSLGTEWGRRLYSNVWVDAAFEHIKNHPYSEPVTETPSGVVPIRPSYRQPDFVITDCRFKNEVEGSKKNGGLVVRLTRNMNTSTTNHASEAELRTIPLDTFDYVFDNALFGLRELPEAVMVMLRDLRYYEEHGKGPPA